MSSDLPLALLRSMKRIRMVEEAIANRYPDGKMRCPTHLSIGQEAVAAAVGAALRRDDLAVSGHRAHAHYLGKGGDLAAMVAEIYGKKTGCARGRGGSMHLIDEAAGFKGSTAIVGGTVPVGVGLGLALKMSGGDSLVCIFIGDAVIETGVFFEATNFAVLKKLPVLFVCENNLYSVYSPLRVRQPEGREIWQVAGALGMAAGVCDGNDVMACFAMVNGAVASVRDGGGPCFLEFKTYRWREHCGPFFDNDLGYRTQSEFLEWKNKEPIGRLEQHLLAGGCLMVEQINEMEDNIRVEIEEAFAFAEQSPFPLSAEALMEMSG